MYGYNKTIDITKLRLLDDYYEWKQDAENLYNDGFIIIVNGKNINMK